MSENGMKEVVDAAKTKVHNTMEAGTTRERRPLHVDLNVELCSYRERGAEFSGPHRISPDWEWDTAHRACSMGRSDLVYRGYPAIDLH